MEGDAVMKEEILDGEIQAGNMKEDQAEIMPNAK